MTQIVNPEIRFIKTHEDAKLPTRNHNTLDGLGDSGYDVYSVEPAIIEPGGSEVIPVGLTLAHISPGYWFRIEARSGLGFKKGIIPHFGIVDNPYRGDLGVKLYNFGKQPVYIEKGDRIAQFVVYPLINTTMSFTDEITQTQRGEKGLGSSGN